MTKVIQARGFRDDVSVSISDLLGKPENAGLIVRRENQAIPVDACEPGSTFLVRVVDSGGKPRRICFVSLGSYGVFYSGRKVNLGKEEIHFPTAWCLCQQKNQGQWVGFQVFARLHQGRNRFVRPRFSRSSQGTGYSYTLQKDNSDVFISLRELSQAFAHVLDGQAHCGPFKWEKNAARACHWIAYHAGNDAQFRKRVNAAADSLLVGGAPSPEALELVEQVRTKFEITSLGKIAHLFRWALAQ
jgi:hypothetical protein